MQEIRRLLLAVAFVLLAPAGFAADLKALEEAARKEGDLTWYSAHYPIEVAEEIGGAFNKRYGIKVNVVRTTAQVAYQRLLQDIKNGAANCDVFSSTDIGHPVTLKKEGRLEKFTPEAAKDISPEFQNLDPDGYFHATQAGMMLMVYNTKKVKPEDAPKTWTDALAPKWNKQLATGHPGFSGYVGVWSVQMRKLYGWGFFEKLEKLSPQIGRSANDPVTMLNSGERSIGFSADVAPALSIQKGNPLAIVYPTDGAVLVISPSAIMKNARHPNAAKLFMEFLYSPDVAKIHTSNFGVSLRPDVPPAPGQKALKDIKTIRPSVQELVDQVQDVIEKWRDTFGN